MKVTRIEDRLAFLGLDADGLALLKHLRPCLEQNARALWLALRRGLMSAPPLAERLQVPGVEQQLEGETLGQLLALASDRFDADFVEVRRRIGRNVQRTGLDVHWIVRGCALCFSMLAPLVSEWISDRDRCERSLHALGQRIALDAEVMIEAFIDEQSRKLDRVAQRIAARERKLHEDLRARGAELASYAGRVRVAEELASIGTLVAGLAHEVGTPMSVIQGHAKMLEGEIGDDEARWRLATIREQIDRIARIIDTLLAIANPRRHPHRPVALRPLIEKMTSFVSHELRERGIDAKLHLEPTPPVLADPDRLQQLVLNLLMNAIDAMPDGGELTLSAWESDEGVHVQVADSGPGIAPELVERIFDPFFTTKEASRGNGLGLVVCRGIASDHDGRIDVESTPGGGATFTVTLPIPAIEDAAKGVIA